MNNSLLRNLTPSESLIFIRELPREALEESLKAHIDYVEDLHGKVAALEKKLAAVLKAAESCVEEIEATIVDPLSDTVEYLNITFGGE